MLSLDTRHAPRLVDRLEENDRLPVAPDALPAHERRAVLALFEPPGADPDGAAVLAERLAAPDSASSDPSSAAGL